MNIEFKYQPEDFEEATSAKASAIAGRQPRKQQKEMPLTVFLLKIARFLPIAVFIWWGIKWLHASHWHLKLNADPLPTHNFLQTLLVSIVPPFFLGFLVSHVAAKSAGRERVPYYALNKIERTTGRKAWLVCAWCCLAIAVGALVGIFVLPIDPDWRPNFAQLFGIWVWPWIGCLFFIGMTAQWIRSRMKRAEDSQTFDIEASSLRELIQMQADEDGLTFSTPLTSNRMAWPFIVSYVESENLLSLFTRDLTMQIVPKRAFIEPGSFETFCGLVQSKVPAGQFLPRRAGFAVVQPAPTIVQAVQALPVSEPFAEP